MVAIICGRITDSWLTCYFNAAARHIFIFYRYRKDSLMPDVPRAINDNRNVIQTISGSVASIGLEQTGRRVAGVLVTPATWAANHAADGSSPGVVDVGIWLLGLISGPASIATGTIKAFVDDDINRRLAIVRSKEPSKYAKTIRACSDYGIASPAINAMTIANRGGTAWITNIGLWVYITDAKGQLVADYEPKEFVTMYRPKSPYRQNASGGFDWEVVRKR